MALVVKDRVQQTSTTTSTGAYTLSGSVAGYQDFSVIGNGNTTYYAATNGTDWEVGIGTYTASGTTLSRDTILASSNSNNAVNWAAGTKSVFVTYPAGKSIYQDASGNTFVPNLGASTASSAAVTTLSASGVATFSAGTAAAPAITTSVDTNNGIFFPAADVTAITTAGTERMRVDASGNVGIGTNAPSVKFEVNGEAKITRSGVPDQHVLVTHNAGSNFIRGVSQSGNAKTFNIEAEANSSEIKILHQGAQPISFYTSSTERMRLDSSGNLGIGTTPSYKLDVLGTTGIRSIAAATQDAVIVAGRAGGTGSYAVTLTPTTLSASRTLTLPDASGTVLYDGGPLGTPSSGTVTNLTGTASININGTVGATTPAAGAFTTLSASGVATFSAGSASAPAITTSGDTNNGIFFPAADVTAITTAGSERLRVNSSGNVGIGTTSATGLRLNVVGAAGAYAAQFYVNTGGAVTTGLDSYSLAIGGNISNGGAEINIVYGSAGGGLAFNSFNGTTITERVRFDASGNVGIGTSSALGVLHTSISGAPNYFYLDAYGNDVNIVGGRTNGTSGAPTALSANNSILTLGARGYDGTAFTSTVKAFIGMYASENWSATAQGTYITFNTTAAGTTTRSEVMRIDGSGNVGIGTSSPGAKVDVVGQIAASYNNTTGVVNTAAQALGTNTVSMVLISADTTLTSTVPAAGARATVIIKTSGTTTRTVTFGTGFKSQGTLATGATADRFWVVNFISDGTSLYETGRTTTAYA